MPKKKTDHEHTAEFWGNVERLMLRKVNRRLNELRRKLGLKLVWVAMHDGEERTAAGILIAAAEEIDPDNEYARLAKAEHQRMLERHPELRLSSSATPEKKESESPSQDGSET